MKCIDHDSENAMGYVQWHAMANVMFRKGIKQQRCDQCSRWFYPAEMHAIVAECPRAHEAPQIPTARSSSPCPDEIAGAGGIEG